MGDIATWLQELMNSLLTGTENKLQTSFQGVYSAVVDYSNGIVAIGLFIMGTYLIIRFLATGQLDFSYILHGVIIMAIYFSFTASVDPKSGSSLMAITSQVMDKFQESIVKEQSKQEKLAAALEKGAIDGRAAEDNRAATSETKVTEMNSGGFFSSLLSGLVDLILNFFDMLAEVFMVFACFIIEFVSKFGCWILIAFAPFCVAISFIKGFEYSFSGMLKYFIVFKLWGVIAESIKLALFNLGMSEQIAYAKGYTAVSMFNSPTLGSILIKICFGFLVLMTPMFADIFVSGSQSGGFFSYALGKASSSLGMTTAMGGSARRILTGNKYETAKDTFKKSGGLLGGVVKKMSNKNK